MCLTIVHHQSELEIRSPAVINPFSGNKYFNPYQTILEEYHYGGAIGENFCTFHGDSASCIKNEWQICRATDTAACHGWQNFHIRIPRDEEFDILHHPVSKFLRVSKVKHHSNDTQIPYIKVRQGLFDARSDVASLTRDIVANKRRRTQGIKHIFSSTFTRWIENDLRELRISLDELKRWTSEWEAYADQGKMEVCPAKDFDSHPYAAYFEVVPGTDDMPSPNQVLREGAGTQPDGPA